MKKIFIYLLLILNNNLIAQDNNIKIDNTIELSSQLLITSKLDIEKNYPTQASDFSSAPALAFQFNLIWHKEFSKKWYYQFGVMGGMYGYRQKIRTQEDFVELGFSTDLDSRGTLLSSRFAGVNIGGNYHIITRENEILSLGIGLNSYYFPITSISSSVSAKPDNQPTKRLFSSSVDSYHYRKIFFAPELNISYFKKISRRINLKCAISYAYSGSKIFIGDYFLFGDDETLDGRYALKLQHLGLSVGILYLPRKNKN